MQVSLVSSVVPCVRCPLFRLCLALYCHSHLHKRRLRFQRLEQDSLLIKHIVNMCLKQTGMEGPCEQEGAGLEGQQQGQASLTSGTPWSSSYTASAR